MGIPVLREERGENKILPFFLSRFMYEDKELPYVGPACVVVPRPGQLFLQQHLPAVIGDQTITTTEELKTAQDSLLESLIKEDHDVVTAMIVVEETPEEDFLCV